MQLFQTPNLTLIISVLALAASLIPGLQTFGRALAIMAFTAWAFDELKYGDNKWRRILGALTLVAVLVAVLYLIHSGSGV